MASDIPKRVTLKTLAEKTGLAVPTISAILNNRPDCFCSREKRDEVLELARKFNYQPNIGYKIMTGKATNIVAIIVSSDRILFEEHNSRLINLLICELESRGYASYISVCTADKEANLRKLRELETKGCRGFLFIGCPMGVEEMCQYVYGTGYPYAGINTTPLLRNVALAEGAALLEYRRRLTEMGIAKSKFFLLSEFRRRADVVQMEQSGVLCPADIFEYEHGAVLTSREFFDSRFELGMRMAQEVYEREPEIGAMIFLGDYIALGAAVYLQSKGVRIGREVLLFGMFHSSMARFSAVPLISADFNMRQVTALVMKCFEATDELRLEAAPEIVASRSMALLEPDMGF